ncbi:MAG: polysaccharide deacetylase family protein [bacterium]|nr:polysaccharide deacetylase family protein [bacterium]
MDRSRFIYSALALLLCLGGTYAVRAHLADDWSDRALLTSRSSPALRYNLVPILCFHNVDGKGPYSVSQAKFREYLQQIRDAGIRVIPLQTLHKAARENRLLTEPSLVITIDDDYKNIVRVAAPILREFRYPASFFFYTADILNDPRWGTSWEDLRRLHAEGFDIQNHSYSHTIFHVRLPGESRREYDQRLHREIYTSREILQREVPDANLYAFAYPMGYFSDHLRDRLIEAGYELLLTTDSRPVDLTARFNGTFDRYTIQKRFVRNPEAMFHRQLQYALRPYDPDARDVAAD